MIFVQTFKLALIWQTFSAKFEKIMVFLSHLIDNSNLQTFFKFHSNILTGFDLTGFFRQIHKKTLLDFLQFFSCLTLFVLLRSDLVNLPSNLFSQFWHSNPSTYNKKWIHFFEILLSFSFFRFANSSNWERSATAGVLSALHCAQWAKNRYQKDSHCLICKCSENSECQHFPLHFTIKTQ